MKSASAGSPAPIAFDLVSTLVDASFSASAWPADRPHCAGSFIVHATIPDGSERTLWGWIDEGWAPSTHLWPGGEPEPVFPVAQISPERDLLTVTIPDFAQQDALLWETRYGAGHAAGRTGQGGGRTSGAGQDPSDALERAAAKALTGAVSALAASPVHEVDGDLLRVSTPLPSGHPAHGRTAALDLASWHTRDRSGEWVRALQRLDPVVTPDTGDLRGRRVSFMKGGHQLGEMVVPVSSDPVWWAFGSSPLLDRPTPSESLPSFALRVFEHMDA